MTLIELIETMTKHKVKRYRGQLPGHMDLVEIEMSETAFNPSGYTVTKSSTIVNPFETKPMPEEAMLFWSSPDLPEPSNE